MSFHSIRIAAITMTSGPDVEQNYHQALSLIRQAATAGATWVVLPEMFSYLGLDLPLTTVAKIDATKKQELANLARNLHITIFAGSICEEAHDKLVYNTAYVYGPKGDVIAKYRKIHLFNLFSLDGKKLLCESERFAAGNKLCVFKHEGLTIGLAICYDLRFSHLFAAMAKEEPLDVIMLPSAFTAKTGAMHWELLCRSRAVEYQCYVIGANQGGHHYGERYSFGHSLVVDPLGFVQQISPNGIAFGTLELVAIEQARRMIPIRSDKSQIPIETNEQNSILK